MIKFHISIVQLILLFLVFASCSNENTHRVNGQVQINDSLESVKPMEELLNIPPHSELINNFSYEVLTYNSDSTFNFDFKGFEDSYSTSSNNILCFRGDPKRNSPSRGNIKGKPIKVRKDWVYKTRKDVVPSRLGTWGGGSGWTGQPLTVQWNKEMKLKLGITDEEFINDNEAIEVTIGSLSGDIYFLNFENGKPTRNYLTVDGPIKGTPSIDPRLNGYLYVGQGIPKPKKRMGSYVLDMVSGKVVYHQPGIESDAYRRWGAFDSNPLIDKNSGLVIWPSENGLIYRLDVKNHSNPILDKKIKYTNDRTFRYGIESSFAGIGKYGFFADNSGNILCVDMSTLKVIWTYNHLDDTDASIMAEIDEKGDSYIYVGNEVDKRAAYTESNFAKISAVTGEKIWSYDVKCYGTTINGKQNSGGILASPLMGKGKFNNIVVTIFSRVNKRNGGLLVAVDKNSGEKLYEISLDSYSWASPIDIYDDQGNMYLFFTDVSGNIYLIKGDTGEIIYKENLDMTFESSPIVINDRIVVGVRGNSIISFVIETE